MDDFIGLKANVSLHKQLIDCLAEAGTTGMTLNELSAALGNFDKRTIDLLLNRLEKDPPPAHLADLGIAQLAETHGRERRYKYYTVAHYLALAEREGFEDRRYRDVDMSTVGAFLPVEDGMFYEEGELDWRVRAMSTSKTDGTSARAKGKKHSNPILPDGSVKKGRPRKSQAVNEDGEPMPTSWKKGKGKKRKREETEGKVGSDAERPPKKKRGRPSKTPVASIASEGGPSQVAPTPKKRGRPPKKSVEIEGEGASAPAGPSSEPQKSVSGALPPKKRGRPRKVRELVVDVSSPDEAPVHPKGQEADVTMSEGRASSPLSSLPSSPAPTSPVAETRNAEDAIQIVLPSNPADKPESPRPAFPSQDDHAEGRINGLRRSGRMPKARKQIEAPPSPPKSTRRGRPSVITAAIDKEEQAKVMRVDEPTSSQSPAKDTAHISVEEGPSRTAPLEATGPINVPVDPALIGSNDWSHLAHLQGHSLIAMVRILSLTIRG